MVGTVEWKRGCHSFGGLLGSQLVSSVAMSEDNLRNLLFSFLLGVFSVIFFLRFSALQCLAKRRKMSATLSQFQYACIVICFPTCLLQVLLSYLVSRLSGKSFIVHGVNIQVNVTTVDLNFSTAMDRQNNTSGRARL